MELFPFISCFFCEKITFKVAWAFLCFCSLFIVGSETNSAAYCDTWYVWGTERKRPINKGPWELFEGFCPPYLLERSVIMLLCGVLFHISIPYIIRHKLQKWLHSKPQCWWPKIGKKTIFFMLKNDGYARKKVENIIVHGLRCKYVILVFFPPVPL